MNGNEIRSKYLDFMKERNHAIVPSSALVPENDPTTLFTGSGMQSMLPYLLGETHPKGVRIVDSQKCFRADDIEEVGDNRHTTFFEMLGNWSFGDYFKEEQIEWMFEFLVTDLKIDPARLYITVFGGDEKNNLPKDEEAPLVWQRLFAEKEITAELAFVGSEADGYARGMNDGERIFYYDAGKNWWSRAGVPDNMPVGEPGGPDSEMFYDFGTEHNTDFGEHCHPNCDCGRFMEIGNNVFMQYGKKGEDAFEELANKNIDFGGGLERIIAAVNNDPDVFKTDLLWNVVKQIQELTGKKYDENLEAFRVITDHIRGAVFMIGDGVLPGNTEQGYFVRRLLRRSVRYADMLGMPEGELKNLAESVIETYSAHYTNLEQSHKLIVEAIATEETQFRKTLEKGLRQFNKINSKTQISAQEAFDLFTTNGFPVELTQEIAAERDMDVDMEGFKKLMETHKETSRAGAEHKFKGGLADQSDKVVQYHTVTHLMLAGLRTFLGNDVHQAGSNITGERLRFDFTHGEKVEREVLDKVEAFVNNAIQTGGKVTIDMMDKDVAHSDPTIEGSFWDRYPDEVKVYSVTGTDNTVFSRELCGGPHVSELEDITGTFRITKEESSSAGVRRVKAILES